MTEVAARCLYCSGTDLEPSFSGVKDRLGHVPGERRFLRCRACRSVVLDPLPRTEELAAFYPPVYSFSLELGGSRLKRFLSRAEYALYFRPQYRAQVRSVMRGCGWSTGKGKKLLDVGCGRGLRLLEFRRLGFDVQGLDLQPDVVRHLNEDLGIPATCADVTELRDRHELDSFDLITTYFLIEHVPDVQATFAAMFDLLKPGGWVAAAVPLVDSVQARVFGKHWINVNEAPRHVSLPTQNGAERVCRAVGFEDVRILPDSALNCAGQVASSAVTGATLTHVYGQKRLLPLAARALGGVVMLMSVPWSLFENRVLGLPPLGVVLARKPG
jgi:SAM-dependent methyltransferase